MKRDLSGYIFAFWDQGRTAPGNAHIFFRIFRRLSMTGLPDKAPKNATTSPTMAECCGNEGA